MSISIDRQVKTVWHEWTPGEVTDCQNTIFQEVIFDKVANKYRIRLVFELDLNNQYIVNMTYPNYPKCLEIALNNIGKKTTFVEAVGTQQNCSYRVVLEDGHWFSI